MRLTNTFSGRPAFYDRNPTTQSLGGSQYSQSPHATTARYTYTVPAARKAQVTFLNFMAYRISVATTAGAVDTMLKVTPSGGGAVVVMDQELITNLVGDSIRATMGGGPTLVAGDQIVGQDFDGSTNGTVSFNESLVATEYDA